MAGKRENITKEDIALLKEKIKKYRAIERQYENLKSQFDNKAKKNPNINTWAVVGCGIVTGLGLISIGYLIGSKK